MFVGGGEVMLHEMQGLCACDLEYCEHHKLKHKLRLTVTVFSYFSVVYLTAQAHKHK